MIELMLLLQITLILWYISFIVFDHELFAPAPLFFLGFIISIALAMVGRSTWNTYRISNQVLSIIVVGHLGALFGCLISNFVTRIKKYDTIQVSSSSNINESVWKYILLAIVLIFAIVLRVIETRRLGMQVGYDINDYSSLSNRVRYATSSFISSDALEGDMRFSFIERQLEKVVYMTGYASTYLIANKLAFKKYKRVLLPVILFILCCVFQLTTGGRGMIFYWTISFFTCFSMLLYEHKSSLQKLELSISLIRKGLIAAFAMSIFMYFASSVVGRKATVSITDYVSFYFGGPIPSLQLLLSSDALNVVHSLGSYTFYNVYLLLYRLSLINDMPAYSLTWVTPGNHYSNIFTCYSRYFADFGLIGVFSLSFFSILMLSIFYYSARHRMKPTYIAVTSYLMAYTFDCAREEFFFSRLISINTIICIVILIMITHFITYRRTSKNRPISETRYNSKYSYKSIESTL